MIMWWSQKKGFDDDYGRHRRKSMMMIMWWLQKKEYDDDYVVITKERV